MSQKVNKQTDSSKQEPEMPVEFMGQEVAIEDPVATFIAKNSKRIVIIAVVAIAAWFGYRYYENQNLEARRSAADLLAAVELSLEELVAEDSSKAEAAAPEDPQVDAEKKADADIDVAAEKKALEEKALEEKATEKKNTETKNNENLLKINSSIQSLQQAVQPYPQLANFYSTVTAVKNKSLKIDEISYNFDRGYVSSELRYVQELQDLLQAKYALDLDQAKGASALKTLVGKADYVAVAAAGALASIASEEKDRKEALVLIAELSKRQPESAGVLEPIQKELQK